MINRNKNIIIIAVLGVVLTVGIVFFTLSKPDNVSSSYQQDSTDVINVTDKTDITDKSNDTNDTYENITNAPTEAPAIIPTPTIEPEEPFVPATEIDLDPGSITVFVNPEHSLPKSYIPDNLVTVNVFFNLKSYDERTLMRAEAAQALERLFAAAREDGYELCGVSGYRSYSRQKQIFINNILTKGREYTLKYSAVPGASEHQTGLAMDVSCKSLRYNLSTSFSETPEGKWLAQNAHHYGYIIRYPKGKAHITGYAYEPWHIRYVGKGLAKYLYENDLTLEEYYNYTPGRNFDFEEKYADLINITPSPEPSIPEPTGTDGIITDENGEIIDEPDIELSPTVSPDISDIPDISPTPVPEDEQDDPFLPDETAEPNIPDETDEPALPDGQDNPEDNWPQATPSISDIAPDYSEITEFPDINITDPVYNTYYE